MAKLANSGVTISKVRNTLNSTSNKVSVLCKSSRVNLWSKFKPFRSNHTNSTTMNQFNQKLYIADYGLSLERNPNSASQDLTGAYGTLNHMWQDAKNGYLSKWVYNKPRGKQFDEPFRLGDFREYYHQAHVPIWAAENSGTLKVTEDGKLTLGFYVTPSSDESGSLTLYELKIGGNNFRNYYFGILMYDDTNYWYGTTNTKVGDALDNFYDDLHCDITNLNNLSVTEKQYHILPFITTRPDNPNEGTNYPFEFAETIITARGYQANQDEPLYLYNPTVLIAPPTNTNGQYAFYVMLQCRNNTSHSITENLTLDIKANSFLNGKTYTIWQQTTTINAKTNWALGNIELFEIAQGNCESGFMESAKNGDMIATFGFGSEHKTSTVQWLTVVPKDAPRRPIPIWD